MSSDDCYISWKSSLHEELLAIELAHFSLCAISDRFAFFVEFGGDLAVLQQCVHSGRCVESWNPGAGGPDALRQCTLRTKLDLNIAAEVLLFKRLVVAQEAYDQFIDLAILGKMGKSADFLNAGIVGNSS